MGLTSASDIESSMKSTGCALALTFDDLINGNISESGTFFAGITTVSQELVNLNDNLGFVEGQLNDIDSDGPTIIAVTTDFTTFETELSELSAGSGSPDTLHSDITYGPFIASGDTTTSIMPAILGRISSRSSSIGLTYSIAKETKDAVVSTSDSAQAFQNGINTFRAGFGDVETLLADLQDTLDQLDGSMTSAMGSINESLAIVTMAVSILFGVIIGLSLVGIVGALVMTFCNLFKCRYLIYFACVFLFLIGVVMFAFSVVFTALTPLLYYTCEFLTSSTSSQQNFEGTSLIICSQLRRTHGHFCPIHLGLPAGSLWQPPRYDWW